MTLTAFPSARRVAAAVGLLACAILLPRTPAKAQGLPLIRDTEIENLLKDYSLPIFKVAHVASQNITIHIVRNDSFNAFVADGHTVYIHTGTLQQAKTPNEVIGVFAHETGHITGGHLAALRARIAHDQTKALLISVLGIGAMIAGATSRSDNGSQIGGLGQGVMLGGNDVIMRGILSERRAQESSADQAGLTFLTATHQSGKGMLAVFERFRQQEYISEQQQDPYMRTHPVAADRLARLEDAVRHSPYVNQLDSPALQLRHDMMRAKIAGFLDSPQRVANRYPPSDHTLPARYARAIAANCSGRCATAIGQVDALIAEMPQNPYFHELKGDMLFAAGKVRESIPPMLKGLQLLGQNSSLMEVNLAEAMLATDDPALLDDALNRLRRASIDEEDNSAAFQLLSTAYYKKHMEPQANLAVARANFIDGDYKKAAIFAKRAQAGLKPGTPEWIRSEDIITYKPEKQG